MSVSLLKTARCAAPLLKTAARTMSSSAGSSLNGSGPEPIGCAYSDMIGNTKLIDLTQFAKPQVEGVRVYAKAEFLNPGYSVKDRIISHIFKDAEETGALRPGGTVVSASSGNTGAATAMVAAMRGYRAVITTSGKCSSEKIDSIRAYGAVVIVCPDGVSEDHPDHYMNVATRLAAENDDWFDVNQYDNLQNPEAHYGSLGPEIWDQTNGSVTHFVAAGSTGGTISGNGRYLKEQNPDVKVILADPVGSIFTSYFQGKGMTGGKYLVEGVGKGSIPGAMDFSLIDDVLPVSDDNAFAMCHYLASHAGILAGGSSGLNAYAAIKLANQVTEPSTIVTIMPDTGIKYLSKIYNPAWLEENGIVTGTPNFADGAGRPFDFEKPAKEEEKHSEEYVASQVFQNQMFGAGSPS